MTIAIRSIALITCEEHPELPEDDRLLLGPLRDLGFQPSILRWDNTQARFDDFPLLVLRAPWDYHQRLGEFTRWLDEREQRGTRVLNPPSTVRWNADKRYLRDLSAKGIAVVETHFLEPGEDTSLENILSTHGWSEVVLKPAVSAGAHLTEVLRRGDDQRYAAHLAAIHAQGFTAMVQPFLHEVRKEGEWSFLFFGRVFSHAVLKRPATGDFRVQELFGGSTRASTPPAPFLETARAVLAAVDGPLLYARVDGIPVRGRLQTSELELIEPSLFLHHSPLAAKRFASALDEAWIARGDERFSASPARSR